MPNNEPNDVVCECGHRATGEHVAGSKECTVPGCGCVALHPVDIEKAKERVCFHCGKMYKCSHPSTSNEGVCNVCRKQIERDYRGDLMVSLFGYRDDLISKLKAQVLAMEIKNADLNVEILWNHWKDSHQSIIKVI